MKYVVIISAFFFSMSAFAQQLKTKPVALPPYLSLLKFPDFKAPLSAINNPKIEIKTYMLTNDELQKIRIGNFFINSKSLNKNFTFSETPKIDLNTELKNVMPVIPSAIVGVGPKGFTL